MNPRKSHHVSAAHDDPARPDSERLASAASELLHVERSIVEAMALGDKIVEYFNAAELEAVLDSGRRVELWGALQAALLATIDTAEAVELLRQEKADLRILIRDLASKIVGGET